jgi:hypothetical protein
MNSRFNSNGKSFGRTGRSWWQARGIAALLGVAMLFVGVIQGVIAESRLSTLQQLDPSQVASAIRANSEALRAFVWQQRMQIQIKGETKKVTLNQINYDVNGNQQKTLLSEQPPAESSQSESGRGLRGRAKKKVVEKKTSEFKEMMEGLAAFVKSYTEIPHDRLQNALKQAAFSRGQGELEGSVRVQMSDVLQPGDSFTLWIDQQSMLFRRVAIATFYEKQPLTVTADYSALQTGQVYMGQAKVNYPAKQVVLQIDNMNYQSGR